MVQVIEGKDRARHAGLFETLFRARYETFVVNRRWSLPARNGLEIDQYDTDQAVYFSISTSKDICRVRFV
ncbi:hypothetical protein AUC70_00430 [Methyloceanibacter stevinii]|uniref:Acyl-homoserine-lactone synthase n=1 Tax=Methyloceanibacter stevinii TaxID=1774970 RepID=A0A1E3VVG8_9HYPH|nr:acyl-homoserine-lactone synthase [Methyloceanibacter stevinii]ODR97523.1 hypothetical protein AUC70_00430 [Methyloceanibacter stevinii]